MEKGRREIAKSAERSLAVYFFVRFFSLSPDPCTDLLPSAVELFAASGRERVGPSPSSSILAVFFPSNAAFVELQDTKIVLERRTVVPVPSSPAVRF